MARGHHEAQDTCVVPAVLAAAGHAARICQALPQPAGGHDESDRPGRPRRVIAAAVVSSRGS